MVIAAHALWVATSEEAQVPPLVSEGTVAFTWHPRARSVHLQRLLSSVVELSSEGLLAVVLWTWLHGSAGPLTQWAIPLWVAVQVLVMGVAVGWDADGRTRVRTVTIDGQQVRIGPRRLHRDAIEHAEIVSDGWGPLRRVTMRIRHDAGAVRIAADGDHRRELERAVLCRL